MLTIQPGLIFSAAAVAYMRAAGMTDEDVDADIAKFEICRVPYFVAINMRDDGKSAEYVRDVCRAALSPTATFGGAL